MDEKFSLHSSLSMFKYKTSSGFKLGSHGFVITCNLFFNIRKVIDAIRATRVFSTLFYCPVTEAGLPLAIFCISARNGTFYAS